MTPIEAMLLISRAKKRTGTHMPVPYDHVKDSVLELTNFVRNGEGKILFCQVEIKAYIKWLEETHSLFPKRANLLNVLRNSLRKP